MSGYIVIAWKGTPRCLPGSCCLGEENTFTKNQTLIKGGLGSVCDSCLLEIRELSSGQSFYHYVAKV